MVTDAPVVRADAYPPPLIVAYCGDRMPQSAHLLQRRLETTRRVTLLSVPALELRSDFLAVGAARVARILAIFPHADVLAAGLTAWPVLDCAGRRSLSVRRLVLTDPRLPNGQAADDRLPLLLAAVTTPTLLLSSNVFTARGHHIRHLQSALPSVEQFSLHPVVGHWFNRFPAEVGDAVAAFLDAGHPGAWR